MFNMKKKSNYIREKNVYLLTRLHSRYGLGFNRIRSFALYYGLNPTSVCLDLKQKYSAKIYNFTKKIIHSWALRKLIESKLSFLWRIKTYKGIRHKLRYPARGQRTRTNARTKKKFKFYDVKSV